MTKVSPLALGLLAVLACPADALELKNARAAYGFLSATRPNNKYLPGDFVNFVYDIEDIKTDPKTGVAKLEQSLEMVDTKGTVVFGKKGMGMEIPLFGAHRMPSFVQAIMTFDQKPGKYRIKVTVTDKLAKDTKSATYNFELLPQAFGIVQAFTPAVAFTNQDFLVNFAVTGMGRDKKGMPDVELTMRLLGKDGKPLVPTPVVNNIKEWHNEQMNDLTKQRVIPLQLPLVLTTAGTFTIEVRATDRISKKTETLNLPLTVVDAQPYLKAARVSHAGQ